MTTQPWMPPAPSAADWPKLPAPAWSETIAGLHLRLQVVGKVRLVCGPWLNHSWGVTLYLTPGGLTTGLVPYGSRAFRIEFDFARDRLVVDTTDGERREVELRAQSIADFHRAVLRAMDELDMHVEIDPQPNEIPDAVPFDEDTHPRPYDPEHARALWRALLQTERVFQRFRADFLGKSSPVHLFWGALDLAVTRFSGRTAPPHPGGMPHFPLDVAREAYSHEVSSVGFWPGNRDMPEPIFYAYAYPEPDGFAREKVEPRQASWSDALHEFVLPYEAVRTAKDPDAALTSFLKSTHAAAARLAEWDPALECESPRGPDWWRERRSAI